MPTLSESINQKKELLKNTVGCEIKITRGRNTQFPYVINWPKWDYHNLPDIEVYEDATLVSVHLLHELIHLEYFFVNHYPIVCSTPDLHPVIHVFKNIPEDYIAHKVIFKETNLNPIGDAFLDRDLVLDHSVKQLAANLVQYYLFSEFHDEYKKRLQGFMDACESRYPNAFILATAVLKCMDDLDFTNKDSYTKVLFNLINIFEPELNQSGSIYPCTLIQENGRYVWQSSIR